jgi:hypothetical protein
LYNEDERIIRFVEAILPFAKSRTLTQANEKDLWKQVFNPVKYNRPKYVRLLSDTVKKAEHFLVIDRFNQQKQQQYAYQLEIMNEYKLNAHVPELLTFSFKKQQAEPLRDAAFYYNEFQLQQQQNLFIENKDQRQAEKNLQDVVSSLDNYYLYQKLKYTAAMLHYQNFLTLEADMPLLNEILQLLNATPSHVPGIQIYRYIILAYTQPENESHYQNLKTLLIANANLFNTEEVKSMFVFAMNYCINRINYGNAEYLNEILGLYKYALQNNLLLEDGMLSQWEYKNILTVALRLKEFKWAEGFMNDYKTLLPKADRANAYTFNLARYYFAVKNYDEVLRLLQDVKYNDIFYQLDSKTTLLKTYYELGEWMPLYSLKDSFRVLLRRKKLISEQQKENYMNLLKLSLKLFKVDVKNKAAMKAIKTEIETTPNVADKSWLNEKLQELL